MTLIASLHRATALSHVVSVTGGATSVHQDVSLMKHSWLNIGLVGVYPHRNRFDFGYMVKRAIIDLECDNFGHQGRLGMTRCVDLGFTFCPATQKPRLSQQKLWVAQRWGSLPTNFRVREPPSSFALPVSSKKTSCTVLRSAFRVGVCQATFRFKASGFAKQHLPSGLEGSLQILSL